MSGITIKAELKCNLACVNCYEETLFKTEGNPQGYDLESIIISMVNAPAGAMTMHGGEPLLMPLDDMRILFNAARNTGREISVQTNGTLITDKHIEMFGEYRASLGVSLNGNGELNDDRWQNDLQTTRKTTQRVIENIERLRCAGISVGIICVLSQTNAGDDDKLERLIAWADDYAERLNIQNIRFNPLHDNTRKGFELSPQRAAQVYVKLTEECYKRPRARWQSMREFLDNLLGLGVQPCWVGECDPYATAAVYAIFGDGSTGNCLRTAKDGTAYLRSGNPTEMRGNILKQIPFADGGCGGCKYWRICKGGCPAESIDDDWRNKSRFCEMYMKTYEYISQYLHGVMPNIRTVEEWTTNDEADLMQSMQNRNPRINAFGHLSASWSAHPSSYAERAREQKK